MKIYKSQAYVFAHSVNGKRGLNNNKNSTVIESAGSDIQASLSNSRFQFLQHKHT